MSSVVILEDYTITNYSSSLAQQEISSIVSKKIMPYRLYIKTAQNLRGQTEEAYYFCFIGEDRTS